MLTCAQAAAKVGCDRSAVRRACERGEIAGAVRTSGGDARGGRWRIPSDVAWKPGYRSEAAIRYTDGSFAKIHRSDRADREDMASLKRWVAKRGGDDAAIEWARRHWNALPQLPRDPVLEHAERDCEAIQ